MERGPVNIALSTSRRRYTTVMLMSLQLVLLLDSIGMMAARAQPEPVQPVAAATAGPSNSQPSSDLMPTQQQAAAGDYGTITGTSQSEPPRIFQPLPYEAEAPDKAAPGRCCESLQAINFNSNVPVVVIQVRGGYLRLCFQLQSQ